MKIDEALARLRALLAGAGVDTERPSAEDVDLTWRVFQQFATESVEDCEPPEHDGDLLLAQFGTYDWGSGEYFELDLTRQFSFVDESGE
jgi:hypothetical protein